MTGDVYELSGLAVPEGLVHLHELLERAATEHPDLGDADAWRFETAVIEIANNVVVHGRPKGKVSWRFVIEVSSERLTATLSDSGEEFTGSLDSAVPQALSGAGRGIPLARATLDELSYERANGVNHWKMVRLKQPLQR